MKPTKRICTVAVAGMMVVAPAALELTCSELSVHELYAPISCGNLSHWFRAPFRVSCDSLIDRTFPPHNHSDNTDDDGAPSTAVVISASGNGTIGPPREVSIIYTTSGFMDNSDGIPGQMIGPQKFTSVEEAKNAPFPSGYTFAQISAKEGRYVYHSTRFGWERC
jgi:hypothetical protein